MNLFISLTDIPEEGLQVTYEVESGQLDLSPEEGEILGSLHCEGLLLPTDERGVIFQGRLTGRMVRECVRCLSTFADVLNVDAEAEFQRPKTSPPVQKRKSHRSRGTEEDLNEESFEDEAYHILENRIDLLPVIREQVILATPFQPLCQKKCLGLCQRCGANLNQGTCGCPVPESESPAHFSLEKILAGLKTEKRRHSMVRKGS